MMKISGICCSSGIFWNQFCRQSTESPFPCPGGAVLPLEATAAAVCAMGLAGEIAHQRLTPQDGNATYRNYIIDAIYNMTPAQLEEGAKYEVR